MRGLFDEFGEFYVVTPKRDLARFLRAEDRAYFARPVRVIASHKDDCGLIYVRDPLRGDRYPVARAHLVRPWALTRRQREGLGLDSRQSDHR